MEYNLTTITKSIYKHYGSFWIDTKDSDVNLWNEEDGFAKIIKHKTPEKLYTLKKEINDMMTLEYTDITKTAKEWLPIHISMLDEVKEVEVKSSELTVNTSEETVNVINYICLVGKVVIQPLELRQHLDKAVKQFIENKKV